MRIEKIVVLETALDHITGEELGMAMTILNDDRDVLDALFLQGIGKKNRPAGLLQVICKPEAEEKVARLVFKHTHALGLRRKVQERYALEREPGQCEMAGAVVPAKIHILDGKEFIRPEADAVAELSQARGIGAPGLRWLKSNERGSGKTE